MDVLLIVAAVGFFVVSIGFVQFCDRLYGGKA